MKFFQTYKLWTKKLTQEVKVLSIACRDRRTPWYAKLLMGLVIAYAASPIDLIPDFIPILGLLDDMLLVPLGVFWCLKMIPPNVIEESRLRVEQMVFKKSYWFAIVIIGIWIMVIAWLISIMLKLF